ncbi:SIR2 family protein [Clostridium perfringens]
MNIEEGIKYVLDGEGLLFLGAGFSTKAINISGSELKTASDFSKELCRELGIGENTNLSDVADFYLENEEIVDNDKKLIEKLTQNYRCKSTSNEHKEVARLDWIRIYTTNYDNVFELASNNVNKRRTGYIISDNIKNIEKHNSILHINGYIDKLTIDQLNDQFKLTTSSYMRDDFSNTLWCGLFRNDLARAKVIFLIGVSMDYDEQLKKMLSENREYKDKIIFIDKREKKTLEESIDKNKMYKYAKRKYGEIYEISLDGFAKKVIEIKKKYKPNNRDFTFKAFEYINQKNYELTELENNDYWSLLIYGDMKEELIFNNITNNNYIMNRTQLNNIQKDLNKENIKVAIVNSDLGNGKTCSMKKLAYTLKDKGEVFWLKNNIGDIVKEIDNISRLPGKKYIFIDDYGNFFDVISKIKIYMDNDINLILSERTSIHASIYYRLRDILEIPENYIKEYNLNKIHYQDRENLIYLLDKVDKWDERGLDIDSKKRKINSNYKSTFREILIKLVRSKNISMKIDTMYNSIKENRIKKNILLAVFINSILKSGLELNDIIALLEIKVTNNILRDKCLNELLDLNTNRIKAKSSILAHYIIQKNHLEKDVLDIMEKMVVKANKIKYGEQLETVIKDFVSESNIILVMGKKDENLYDDILRYYDNLKDLYSRNPFFYLQYAMACLDIKYYERAGEYIEIAYKEAKLINEQYKYKGKKTKFDTFQIDTQNGRYILEKAIEEKTESDPLKTFIYVHKLFIETLKKERTDKPMVYKQVINYSVYFDRYKGMLSYDDRKKYIEKTNEIIEDIKLYLSYKDDYEIKNILNNLEELVIDIMKSMYQYC